MHLETKYNISFNVEDILSLLPGKPINDQIINLYFQYLANETTGVTAWETFLFTKIQKDGPESIVNWIKETPLNSTVILIPALIQQNWSVIIVFTATKRIELIDFSRYHQNLRALLGPVKQLLIALEDKFCGNTVCLRRWVIDQRKMAPKHIKPVLEDCGLYICLITHDIISNVAPQIIKCASAKIRKRMVETIVRILDDKDVLRQPIWNAILTNYSEASAREDNVN